jgi:hypothetical protein
METMIGLNGTQLTTQERQHPLWKAATGLSAYAMAYGNDILSFAKEVSESDKNLIRFTQLDYEEEFAGRSLQKAFDATVEEHNKIILEFVKIREFFAQRQHLQTAYQACVVANFDAIYWSLEETSRYRKFYKNFSPFEVNHKLAPQKGDVRGWLKALNRTTRCARLLC